jgi:hypothetical protein
LFYELLVYLLIWHGFSLRNSYHLLSATLLLLP